jgi:hypothetical protein
VIRYGLKDRGSIPVRDKNSFLRYRVQTSSGAHQASYLKDIGGSLLRGKVPGGVKLTTHLYLKIQVFLRDSDFTNNKK